MDAFRLWLLAAGRGFQILAALVAGGGGFYLFLQFGASDGIDAFDILRAGLIFISTAWLAIGASGAFLGLLTRAPKQPETSGPLSTRTVVLMPMYNEDPRETFARLAAMDESLQATGYGASFDIAILSDTRDDARAAQEWVWFHHLLDVRGGHGRMFYRRRDENSGKKAGNIESFIATSGAAYDFAVILDADSLMEGETIVALARRMEAAPDMGLIQTLPQIVNAKSRFGRGQQFAAAFHSPVFARGQAMLQGRTGPFWGHNAITRVNAFAESCGLPVLPGKAPFGGHILSHDYVEAALLARNNWTVRLDDDLGGSYEEGPENIVDHAKRDRRWCQGNLQHSKLILAPGLKGWSRFTFLQGILAYISPLFWLAFIIASILAPLTATNQPNYYPNEYWQFPVLPPDQTSKAIGLAVGVIGLLIMPKMLVWLKAALTGRTRGFGGAGLAGLSALAELLSSSLMAPVFLMYQTRSVIQVLMGRDGGWPPNNRGDGRLNLRDAWAASNWISLTGIVGLIAAIWLTPALVPWLLPVGLPMIAAPLIIMWSSRPSRTALFSVPQERAQPPIVTRHQAICDEWAAHPAQ
ncbi:glucans biosynthesis glucosyltransferase MdoH [Ketogulonicigenium vulgare]|uniref:Glucans biosynthesis glucosyltransferase H n=1 Tax=Ketogulonicigenium vulgare (strain WSH-001) TaxID=759362 RepID=F9Y8C4_KETVW|nr:glucans biosynthesis glucosyltransferase MdoH [Ketogulonicigenium vulgare]ADO41411.1 glycosyl transferase family 2 [Ketogulonicigenium vulgare Y25]AEM42410.1 Glycosyltransferase probably involved in cell wall biogenesis-like protein [Ketogulonicigenium vulgare WSH-001]ALJ80030.1 glucosyltransferase [Ketogulonicigenium vulgare]ANW32913.1 glucan biosynthesis glucosyltransferase H [Ketogulonicigenium vulgare]AOZ53495.1 glycosyltransferase, family 2 [Ketogulonicigenium vulgare]